jgi:hypothetical protein
MTKNARLSGSIDQIDLAFIEREATPQFLMKLSIQLHLAGLSLSNTVSVLEIFGVNGHDPPFTIGFTKLIYSPKKDKARITLRLTRP